MFIRFTPDNKNKFLKDIEHLKPYMSEVDYNDLIQRINKKKNKKNFFKLTEPKGKRSIEQNNYYWGGIIPFIHKLALFPKLSKYSLTDKVEVNPKTNLVMTVSESYHGILSEKFLGYQVTLKDGSRANGTASSSTLSVDQFTVYTKLIEAWVLEETGLNIPTPEDYDMWDIYVADPKDTLDDFHNYYIANA